MCCKFQNFFPPDAEFGSRLDLLVPRKRREAEVGDTITLVSICGEWSALEDRLRFYEARKNSVDHIGQFLVR